MLPGCAVGFTSSVTLPVRNAFAPALSSNASTINVESFFRDCTTAVLFGPATTPTCSLSGPRCRKARPSPAASRIGKTKVQNTASGSRMNSRKRTSVSWTIELRLNPRSPRESVFVVSRWRRSTAWLKAEEYSERSEVSGGESFIAKMSPRQRDKNILECRGRFPWLWWREIRNIDRFLQLARGPHGDHVSAIDNRDAVAEPFRLLHILRRQHDPASVA